MRVLFTTTPGCGHLFPMVPLAWALRCSGHRVLVAAPRPIAKAVRAAGLEHVPVGGNADPLHLWPDPGGPAGHQRFTMEPWVALAEQTAADTVDLAERWRPDLVVCDYAEYSGPVAAALSNAPLVSHHWGLHLSDELVGSVFDDRPTRRLHALHERFGLLPEETAPSATIDLCPPSMRCFDSTDWLSMRFIPYGGAGIPTPWLWTPRTRPRVCVSMGSVPVQAGVDGLREVAHGLAEFDGEVVLTGVGSRDSALDRLPENVRTAGWLPHDQVFPTCDLVIHHGGSGTAMNSLLFALPQLVMPQMCDQFENAERLVASGVARRIPFDERSTAPIRGQVERLLVDPSYRTHARRIRAEIEAMPAPGELVRPLEELAAAGRPSPSRAQAIAPAAF